MLEIALSERMERIQNGREAVYRYNGEARREVPGQINRCSKYKSDGKKFLSKANERRNWREYRYIL